MGRPIGVLDSGIGGLTVVKSMEKVLSNEEIIYFGDNKNVPYGNRSEDEIYELTMAMLSFFESKDVKLVAIACNTISTMVNRFKGKFKFPIIDIITPTVDHIEKMGINRVLIMGTEFTIKTKAYEKLLLDRNSKYEIYAESSPNLAALVDNGQFYSPEIYKTIRGHIDSINSKGNIYNVVLACTHYPIVEDVFMEIDPTLNYINPGFQQAKAIRMELHNINELSNDNKGSLKVYTSGDTNIYNLISDKLMLQNLIDIESISIESYTVK